MSYHATAALEDAVKLSRKKIPSAAALKLHSFSYDDFSLSDEDTLQVGKRRKHSRDSQGRGRIGLLLGCANPASVLGIEQTHTCN